MPERGSEFDSPARSPHISPSRRSHVRLGQLLVDAGILSSQNLDQSLSIAKDSRQPVGRILVGLKHVRQRDIDSALEAQMLVDEGALSQRSATQALRKASVTQQRMDAVVSELRSHEAPQRVSALGELLNAAGYINAEVYAEAMEKSLQSAVPIGRTLLLIKKISPTDLRHSLKVLFLIHDKKLSQNEALQALHICRRDGVSLAKALGAMNVGFRQSGLGDEEGELLHQAHVVSDLDYLAALEEAVSARKSVPEICLLNCLVSEQRLADARQIIDFVHKNLVTFDEGIKWLRTAHVQNSRFEDVVCQIDGLADDESRSRAVDFLVANRLIAERVVEKCRRDHSRFKMGRSRSLVANGAITSAFLLATMDGVELLNRGDVTNEDVVSALRESARSSIPFLSALAAVGCAPKSASANVLGQFEEAPHPNFIQSEILGWINYPGFIKLSVFAVATPLAAGAIFRWLPAEQHGAALAGLLGTLAVAFVVDAFFLSESAKEKELLQKSRLSEANQTKSRLMERKSKGRRS